MTRMDGLDKTAYEGQVVLVTGGSEGIGAHIVEQMAREGAAVFTVSRSSKGQRSAEELVERGLNVSWKQTDVADAGSCVELVGEVVRRYGRIDVLINNAGNRPSTLQRSIESLTNSDLTEALGTHVHAPFNLSIAAWPYMAKQHYGRILNFCSGHIFGATRDHGIIPFGIAKAGIIGLTKTLAVPGARCGIAVNALFPAALDSQWNRVGWNKPTAQDEVALADICSMVSLWPFIRWICGKSAVCNGEMFSVCNDNVTNVFIGDSENFSYASLENIDTCIKATMMSPGHTKPKSVGSFFSKHLGLRRSKQLHSLLSALDIAAQD